MPYTKAQNRASQKYQQENMQQIGIRVLKGDKERLEEARIEAGYSSTRRFIIDAINEKAGRVVLTPPSLPASSENGL